MQIANNFHPIGFKRLIKEMNGATSEQKKAAETAEYVLTTKIDNKPTPVEYFESIGRDIVLTPNNHSNKEVYLNLRDNDSETGEFRFETYTNTTNNTDLSAKQKHIIQNGKNAIHDNNIEDLIAFAVAVSTLYGTVNYTSQMINMNEQDTQKTNTEVVTDTQKTNQTTTKDTLVLQPEDFNVPMK